MRINDDVPVPPLSYGPRGAGQPLWRARRTHTTVALSVLLYCAMLAVGALALAHYPWITVQMQDAAESFRISFGHSFPEDGLLRVDRLEGIRVVHPDGRTEALELGEREHHPLPIAAAGAGMIVAEQKPAYWSRTHEGGRRASPADYPDAFSCSQSANAMKAMFTFAVR